jgi:membrane protein required for colicin V production
MHGLTLLDILLWAIMIAFAAKGFMKGLVREVCALLGVVAGAWAAFTYYAPLSTSIRNVIALPHPIAVTIAFILIYLVLGLLFFLLGHLLTVIFKIMLLGWLNCLGGILFGFLQGSFLLCILLSVGVNGPLPAKAKGYINSSTTAHYLAAAGNDMINGWSKRHSAGRAPDRR